MTDSPTPINDALARAGLDAGIPTSEASPRILGQPAQTEGHPGEPATATRFAVVSADVIRLQLSDDCNPLASIVLAPADIVGLTADLLAAARIRCGRPATSPEGAL